MTITEDENDLRPYILAVFKYWWIIVLLAGIFGFAALTYSLLKAREYQATTTVLLTRSRATLELAEQFPTINEPIDARARMDSLVSIALSDVIASETYNNLNDAITVQYEDYVELREDVEVKSQGDLLLFKATTPDPQSAVEIASEWAQQTVAAINFAYSGEQPLAVIQEQLDSANQEYLVAQSKLEAFIENNKINLLESRIDEAKTLYTSLAKDRTQQLTYFYDRKLAMEDLIVQAEALNKQLQSGNRSQVGNLGDALAVLKARSTALGINDNSSETPVDSSLAIDLQIADLNAILDTPSEYVADLNDLIALANEEQAKAESTWKALADDVSLSDGYDEIERIAEQVRSLEAQLELETARQTELTSQRDLSWQAYQVIAQKEAELRNAPQEGNLVTIAGLAVRPQRPVPRGTAQLTIIAAIFGGFVGFAIILGLTWWRKFNQASESLPTNTDDASSA
jgi:uncharacterized protein involved in exopolysaccharide biosynthesis